LGPNPTYWTFKVRLVEVTHETPVAPSLCKEQWQSKVAKPCGETSAANEQSTCKNIYNKWLGTVLGTRLEVVSRPKDKGTKFLEQIVVVARLIIHEGQRFRQNFA